MVLIMITGKYNHFNGSDNSNNDSNDFVYFNLVIYMVLFAEGKLFEYIVSENSVSFR